ncbi:pyruvate, phosphate dikinase [Pseudactinotalea sp. HY158]|uniref:pyruvate, phosphate dikinase n=1 Tax=Pseudactinotalea sp. HY158 TaxID=2654547 RepID=UPI00129C74CD|nr:pyruvate, phosphate dikinase [Pseudactinotalea sp. HY158]QGH71137.1 pyruvate, phosphate dikinase [Pseudactinotalea sp. HY158]
MHYVYRFSEGSKELRDVLGGKGANLAEMTNLGLPVPPGFTISTAASRAYLTDGILPPELRVEVTTALRAVEDAMSRRLGDFHDPLLVSVRSGAQHSMPGMMDTVLNVGLNDAAVQGLAESSGDERFAWDSYRRLIQMFGKTVLGVPDAVFVDESNRMKALHGMDGEADLDAGALRELVHRYKELVRGECGREFPQHPREQLDLAIEAVFKSWNSERAQLYRRRERIPHDLGTAVNIQAMVFGNLGATSGTGVAFTRDPSSGRPGGYGDYLPNAQGEDVVSGVRNTLALEELAELDEEAYRELLTAMRRLETHYRDLCDIEFTIERGKLWLLQTRVGKRTPSAAFRIATQLVDESLITMDEALTRVSGAQLSQLLFPQFDSLLPRTPLTVGMGASPGAAVGEIAFTNDVAIRRAGEGASVILVRRETNPDDLHGMLAARGVLTARGGKTSHAAVVARGMGTCAVVGAEELQIDPVGRTMRVADMVLSEGDTISIDGTTGEVFAGQVDVVDSAAMVYVEQGLESALVAADSNSAELVTSLHRLLDHADARRRMGVRANADNRVDALKARDRGAEGIGLCRTEHQFLGDRRGLVEALVLAGSPAAEEAALEALLPVQRDAVVEVLEAMDGLPVTIRLLDPPLHEFLPDLVDVAAAAAVAAERGDDDRDRAALVSVLREHRELNPMLGMRGVRLGLKIEGLLRMQIRAICEATDIRLDAAGDPRPEIMVPLVGSVREQQIVRDICRELFPSIRGRSVPIGCMIELPRAALTAYRIAEEADFFSFGTNDLTQTTWGFSRDDVEATFFPTYLRNGVLTISPFETIDADGVGVLVEAGVAGGRRTKPTLPMGVCGEHGGDPESIRFFHDIGLDYVSCSPYRVPIARLEAGRAAVLSPRGEREA